MGCLPSEPKVLSSAREESAENVSAVTSLDESGAYAPLTHPPPSLRRRRCCAQPLCSACCIHARAARWCYPRATWRAPKTTVSHTLASSLHPLSADLLAVVAETMPGPGLILGGIKATFDKVLKIKDQDVKLSAPPARVRTLRRVSPGLQRPTRLSGGRRRLCEQARCTRRPITRIFTTRRT